jgi:glycosyltransferase involved in cell wall biosynthesis
MKKVLLVAYDYPPSKNVGRVRPNKFVRFLPEFGWEPSVLAVDGPTATEDLPSNPTVEIYRVREWPHPLKMYRGFMELTQKKTRAPRGQDATLPPEKTVSRFKRSLSEFLSVPDQEVGWLIPAILKGKRLIRQKKITHLITTSPPFTSQLVGLALKRLTGVRWVADFRDPCSLNHELQRHTITEVLEQNLIRRVMKDADVVLSVTPLLTEEARKEHPNLPGEKFVTLTNGFDPSDFEGLPTARRSQSPIIISYIGSLYVERSPELFLCALRSLFDEGTTREADTEVKFVGDMHNDHFLPDLIKRFGLDKTVQVHPQVPFREALRLTVEAHVAIVFSSPYSFSSKVYGALAAGAIILHIGSAPEMVDLLARTGRGVSVNEKNLQEMRDGIIECIRRAQSAGTERPSEPWADEVIQPYNFRELTCKLAALMDGLGPTRINPRGLLRRRLCRHPGKPFSNQGRYPEC